MGRSSFISVTMVLAALSDKKSLYLLSKIALAEVDSQFLLAETRLTSKAFYSRMSRLLKTGIISRKNGMYSLTSFGKIVCHAQGLIATALNNYWRLSALDSVGMIDSLPTIEYNKISNTLLGDCLIKNVLVRQLGELTTTKRESLICLNVIPIKTQRARKTLRGPQAT
jgi:DNA-binding HxlR family transcriptional regulator